MVRRTIYVRFWWENLKARDHFEEEEEEEEDADNRMILERIRKKQNGKAWAGCTCLCIGQLVGFCDHVTEL
jgi:hypothetical protein